jgi:hypothetical protein
MKKIFVALLLFVATNTATAQKKMFLRVFDLSGKKMAKGFFAGAKDSSLLLYKDNAVLEVPVTEIGNIQTKRSLGHTVLVVGAVGTAAWTGAFLSIVGDDFFEATVEEAVLAGFIGGAATGLVVGGIAGALKKSKKFTINGTKENWLLAKPILDKLPVYKN